MSTLFPLLDKALVQHIFRNGVRVAPANQSEAVLVSTLETMGLIDVAPRHFVKCAHPEDHDYLDRLNRNCEGIIEVGRSDHAYFCLECGQPLENLASKHHFEDVKILLKPGGIIDYIRQAIASLPNVADVQALTPAAFSVTLTDGRTLTLVVLDYAEARYRFAGFYFAEPNLYVVASSINEPVKHVLEVQAYLSLADLLSQEAAWLASRLDVAAYPIPGRLELTTIEQQFNSMLARSNGWQYFEQQFAPALQTHMATHPALVAQYLGQLKRMSDTVLNYFAVPIGGAGRTDMRPINKFELMNELFTGNAIADAKRYVESRLEQDHVSKILLHLMTDPQRPKRAVVFLSTDQVRSSAWEAVMQLRNNEGYWKIIVLTKYMLLELLAQLEAIYLLKAN